MNAPLPQVVDRPRDLHPPILSITELAEYLTNELIRIAPSIDDSETIQRIGQDAHQRAVGADQALRRAYSRISAWLTEVEEDEQRRRAEEAVEAAWRESDAAGAGGSVEAYRG